MSHSPRFAVIASAAIVASTGLVGSPVRGQDTLDWPVGQTRAYEADSGHRVNAGAEAAVVWQHVIDVEQAAWLRVYFGPDTILGPGSVVRVTSLLDGEVHALDARDVDVWDLSTAYFNGSELRVELVAGPKSAGDRVVIERIDLEIGALNPGGGCGFCEGDSREPSGVDWSARLLPAGCSSSIYNEDSCVVTAGHCVGGNMVIQFRVPASDGDCDLNHPPVAEQFPITQSIFVNNGPGDDWGALTSGPNTLGETAYERYGVFMPIALAPPVAGDPIDVFGYGVDDECVRNQVQQTDTEPGVVTVVIETMFRHRTDATFGNSGSGLVRKDELIGIATHCPCPNYATRMDHPDFLAARKQLCGDEGLLNDDCEDATAVGNGSVPFTTRTATTDGPPIPAECDEGNGVSFRKDVWFLYTATCTGLATASTCNADFNTKMAVYTVGACPGDLVACSDDACGENGTRAAATFDVTAGESYLVRIGSRTGTGDGLLEIDCVEGDPCPEDVDDSGEVTFDDILRVLAAWGPCSECPEDVDASGEVTFDDVLLVLAAWGPCP